MKIRKLMTFVFVSLCLPPIFRSILVLASSSSASLIVLDPVVENALGWDNAWTETIFGNGTPPFKTIIYSRPQVTWNGTQWVEYEIKPVNETAVILRTPTCAYLVGELVVSLFDPNGTSLHMGGMEWVVEQYSVTLNKWLSKSVESARVNYNSTHIWQNWTFPDESKRVLYIGHDNKQTITFTSKTLATCRVAWHFTDINATRIIYSNGTQTELEKGSQVSLTNFNFTRLTLYDQNRFSLSVDYDDIDPSYYREIVSGHSENGSAHVNLIYGNWTINSGESITVDPITETFISEAALDGTLYKYGTSYPPTSVYMYSDSLMVGQSYVDPDFWIFRGYASFDTSPIRDYAVIIGATLKLKTYQNSSTTDFTMRVMGGSQPIYEDSLETADWNCGTTEVATWPSSQYSGNEIYVNITIPTDQINTTGRTQFELKSDREGTPPSGDEYIIFCSGEWSGEEPRLEVTWLPHTEPIHGQWWYYWNSTANKKAAIVLFGGLAVSSNSVQVCSLYYRDYFVQDPWPYYKEKFVRDLH